jgi:hypothetical protein
MVIYVRFSGRDPSWVEKVPENTLYPGRGSKG